MAYRQVTAGIESLDLLHRLQLSPQSKTPDTVLEWTELDIGHAGIEKIPESIDRCTHVQKISATCNMLSSLPRSISNLPHLTVLDLSSNTFTTFPIALCGLTNLEELFLSHNQISDIPVDITRLKVLRIFSLSDNDLTTFPIALCGLTNLEELDLDNNQLHALDIPGDIRRLKGLRIFNFSNNALFTFPIALCGLTNLQVLRLNGNQLSDIPVDTSRLKVLRIFSFSSNVCTTFPIALCGLTNLEELYLSDNQLSDIPVDITRLKALRTFFLSNNAFTTFPIALCGLTNLQVLRLDDNQISDIPVDISRLKMLRIFQLNKNALTTFPIALCGLTNLEEVYLGDNQISDIPVDISRLKVLKTFFLSNNDLTTFPIALCDLTNLERLDLDNNQLSDIPVDISRLTKLETLYLTGNNITHLPPQIKNMDILRRLDVGGNPLVQPPGHTAYRGVDAIKRYFEALTDTNAIQSSRIQVNFLGETEAGKTSISHTLQLGKPAFTKMADRTRVVEQGTWKSDQNIGFNINDFGGHDVYKIGHPIFISKCGLIFITFDLTKYDAEDKAHYQLYIGQWIDKVQAQMPGIKMAVVGTHIDQDEAYQAKCSKIKSKLIDHRQKKQKWYESQIKSIEKKIMNLDEMQTSILQAYEDKKSKLVSSQGQVIDIHDDIFGVSSKTMEGVEGLQNYLTSVAKERAVILPGMWVDAATMVCTKKYEGSENTLGWDKLQDLILQSAPTLWKERNSSNEDLDLATCDILGFLADRGDIIWFDSSNTLKRVVFHKQEILANVLKAVLNHESDAVLSKLQQSMSISEPKAKKIHDDIFSRGMISREAMDCLCEPFRLSTTEADVMVELMQKLELCYQVQEDEFLPSNTSFHFPWLLTEERQPELDTKWPSKVPLATTQLTLQVLFPYKCPDGLYEKFSVRQHKHLGLMKTMRMDWKDGVYAELKGCKLQLTRGPHQSNPDVVNQVPDWVISIAVRGSNLSDMWSVLTQGHCDLMNIIKEDWPGLSYDKYLVCPHCVSEDSTQPTLFPGEILDLTLGTASKPREVTCVNTGVSISAGLVYPPHLVMSWQEVLNEVKPKLCQNITVPGLLDILNGFLQEDIITDHEYEWVKPELPQRQTTTTRVVCPEKTAIFLDTLKTKGERAFDLLREFFIENGQSELASLLK